VKPVTVTEFTAKIGFTWMMFCGIIIAVMRNGGTRSRFGATIQLRTRKTEHFSNSARSVIRITTAQIHGRFSRQRFQDFPASAKFAYAFVQLVEVAATKFRDVATIETHFRNVGKRAQRSERSVVGVFGV
jgi:hypothetical protein